MNTIIHLLPHRPRSLPGPPVPGPAGDPHATVAEMLSLMGAPCEALRTLPPLSVSWQRLHAGATLHHEGAVARAICFVRAGSTVSAWRTASSYKRLRARASFEVTSSRNDRMEYQRGLSMPEFFDGYGSAGQCEALIRSWRWPAGFVWRQLGGLPCAL